jgi:hypothetical protein
MQPLSRASGVAVWRVALGVLVSFLTCTFSTVVSGKRGGNRLGEALQMCVQRAGVGCMQQSDV